MKRKISKRDLSKFNLTDISAYLLRNKWRIVDQSSKAIVFSGPLTDSGNRIILRLPSSTDNSDYFERIDDFINIISSIKQIDIQKVIQEISVLNKEEINLFYYSVKSKIC